MYGLIQTQIRRPRAFSRASMPAGSGNASRVPLEVAPVELRIQKQSKWNTSSGISRSAMPSMKP